LLVLLLPIVLLVLLICHMMWLASSDPLVRSLRYRPLSWPAHVPPVRIILVSDIHTSDPDTPPSRVAHIVASIDALHPDLVLLAGDFVSEHKLSPRRYPPKDAVAPLGGLHPRWGSLAVIGNHDHDAGYTAVAEALTGIGIHVLTNRAVRRGPLAIGGVDDLTSGRPDIAGVAAQLRGMGGVPILFTHNPDIFPAVPLDIGLTLAGHTHCGQISLPLIGVPVTGSRFGRQFFCGVSQFGSKTLVVTAGVGTSVLPFRLGVPPDIWVIDIGDQSP
jgi:predicted MPP superfamily phosphohydrolase